MTWRGTPGPWKADRNHGCKQITAKGRCAAPAGQANEVACAPGLWDEAEDQANAHGIAAVPQLVEALLTIRECNRVHQWFAPSVEKRMDDALRAAKVLP